MAAAVVTTVRDATLAGIAVNNALRVGLRGEDTIWYEELLEPNALCVFDEDAGAVILLMLDATVTGERAWWVRVIAGPTTAWRDLMLVTKEHFVSVGEGRTPLYYPIKEDERGDLVDAETRDILESDDELVNGRLWRKHLAETPEKEPTRGRGR